MKFKVIAGKYFAYAQDDTKFFNNDLKCYFD